MGGDRTIRDLFSTAAPLSRTGAVTALGTDIATPPHRHFLPKDLLNAIKNLTHQELDQLYMAVLTELQRRGRKLPSNENESKRSLIIRLACHSCEIACMRRCVGHHQRMIRRAFIYARGNPVPTRELMQWCYPRRDKLERWHWNVVARAAHKFGTNIRRGWWAPTPDLADQIRPRNAESVAKR